MGQLIESDYGFLKLSVDKHNYLSKNFFNLKTKSEIDCYFNIINSVKEMPTFGADELLPSMPLPSLVMTLDKYLESTKPFVNESQYKKTEKIVEDFKNGIGSTLHHLLEQKAKQERNWVHLMLLFT